MSDIKDGDIYIAVNNTNIYYSADLDKFTDPITRIIDGRVCCNLAAIDRAEKVLWG